MNSDYLFRYPYIDFLKSLITNQSDNPKNSLLPLIMNG